MPRPYLDLTSLNGHNDSRTTGGSCARLDSNHPRAIQDVFSEGADCFNFAVTCITIQEWEKAHHYSALAREVFQRIGEIVQLRFADDLNTGAEALRRGVDLLHSGNQIAAREAFLDAKKIFDPLGEPPLLRCVEEWLAERK